MPTLSLIVPTRGRPEQLARLLTGLADLAADRASYEVILIVDDDAIPGAEGVRLCVGPPGRTMGELNRAGVESAMGDFVMLLNDDVIPRTRHWDRHLIDAARTFDDGVVLVHVNDTLMRDNLCVFPMIPKSLAGLIHSGYKRYRIDDHIEDVFNVLAAAGERRTMYLPEVIFEHLNGVEMPWGVREYHANPEILALDAPLFDELAPERRRFALELLARIDGHRRQTQVGALPDAFALRTTGRQIGAERPTLLARLWRRLVGRQASRSDTRPACPARHAREAACPTAVTPPTPPPDAPPDSASAPSPPRRGSR